MIGFKTLLQIITEESYYVSSLMAKACITYCIDRNKSYTDLRIISSCITDPDYCDGYIQDIDSFSFIKHYFIDRIANWLIIQASEDKIVLEQTLDKKAYRNAALLKDMKPDDKVKIEYNQKYNYIVRAVDVDIPRCEVDRIRCVLTGSDTELSIKCIYLGCPIHPYDTQGNIPEVDKILTVEEAMNMGFEYCWPKN